MYRKGSYNPTIERMQAALAVCFALLHLFILGYGIAVAVVASGLFGGALIYGALSFFLAMLIKTGGWGDKMVFALYLMMLLIGLIGTFSVYTILTRDLGLHLTISSHWLLVSHWINWMLVCGLLAFIICSPVIYWLLNRHIKAIHKEWFNCHQCRLKQWYWDRFKCFGSGVLWLSLLMLSFFLIIQYIWVGGGGPALMVAFATLFLAVFYFCWDFSDSDSWNFLGLGTVTGVYIFISLSLIVSFILSSIALASGILNPFMNVLALAVLVLSAIPLVQLIMLVIVDVEVALCHYTEKTERKAIGYHVAFFLDLIQSALFNQLDDSEYVKKYYEYKKKTFPSAFERFEPTFARWFTSMSVPEKGEVASLPNDYTLSKFKRG